MAGMRLFGPIFRKSGLNWSPLPILNGRAARRAVRPERSDAPCDRARLGGRAEHSAGDLAGNVPKSTMSHHLKILREAGVTSTRPEGMRCRVSLRRTELNRRFPGLLAAILKNAE
jgi:DNA-binding transcriptional ArsR family regulator